jgi:hypothetical protein
VTQIVGNTMGLRGSVTGGGGRLSAGPGKLVAGTAEGGVSTGEGVEGGLPMGFGQAGVTSERPRAPPRSRSRS